MSIGLDAAETDMPSRGDSLAEQVFRQLCSAILAGSFAPEERITIRRLADDWNVSVTPAREAVLRLISDGVLQATDRNAIVVPVRSPPEIQEIFEIRRALEGALGANAAVHMDAEDIAFLEQTQADFMQAIGRQDYKEVLRHNAQFHFRIYRRADLPVHLKIVESLWLRIGPTLRFMYPILQGAPDRRRRHDDIIDAARARDADGLKVTIIADLKTSEKALQRYSEEAAAQKRRFGTVRAR